MKYRILLKRTRNAVSIVLGSKSARGFTLGIIDKPSRVEALSVIENRLIIADIFQYKTLLNK